MAQGIASIGGRRIHRFARWLGLAAALPLLWACVDRTVTPPENHPDQVGPSNFPASLESKLDILFMIDNSQSMESLQKKLLDQFPRFMERLKEVRTADGAGKALPDIHVAVISSDTGPGKFLATPGCNLGGDGGQFRYQPTGTCTASPLHATPAQQTFLAAARNQTVKNYDGDISDAFKCIAALGDKGCGFEGQLKAVRWALDPSSVPPGNEGFLRSDAYLAVILITNEDDCSVPDDSDLIDPGQTRMSDPLGPYWSFRCNEFGHLCNINGTLQPPPRGPADGLQGCVSNETDSGRLTKVRDEVAFLRSLKTDPDNQIFVAAISGVPERYGIEMIKRADDFEPHPNVKPTCTNGDEFADPAVRIKQWADSFHGHGLMQSICDDDFKESLRTIADGIVMLVKPHCIQGTVVDRDPATPALEPECQVSDTFIDAQGRTRDAAIHACAQDPAPPCWSLDDDGMCTPGKVIHVVRGPDGPPDAATTHVACALCIEGVARAGCPCVAGKEVAGCLR
ncbi:MAG TPA: hypothetical protein VFH68_03695 [Polyangia bacterium]|jgi:hypothetical protein|nr:hypothetical protein [Polyangia bacterium]